MSTMTATAQEKLTELERVLIDRPEVARRLGNISLKTVDRLPIPGRIKLAGRVLFDSQLLAKWIADGCPR